MIALLSYTSSGTESVLIPGLIRKGKAAVGPLVEASRQAFEIKSWPRRKWILDGTLFCLGRIGGADAEAFLSKVVAERVDFQDNMDSEWQKTACFAYAECAGARAVPALIEVFKRCEGDPAGGFNWVPLAALVRTASRDGVVFALDNMEVLVRSAERGNNTVARVAAGALLFMPSPVELAALPVQKHAKTDLSKWRSASSGVDTAFRTRLASFGEDPDFKPGYLWNTWEADGEKIRAYWVSALK